MQLSGEHWIFTLISEQFPLQRQSACFAFLAVVATSQEILGAQHVSGFDACHVLARNAFEGCASALATALVAPVWLAGIVHCTPPAVLVPWVGTQTGGDARHLLNFGAAGWAGNIVSTGGMPSRWCWCSARELQLGQRAAEQDTMGNRLW